MFGIFRKGGTVRKDQTEREDQALDAVEAALAMSDKKNAMVEASIDAIERLMEEISIECDSDFTGRSRSRLSTVYSTHIRQVLDELNRDKIRLEGEIARAQKQHAETTLVISAMELAMARLNRTEGEQETPPSEGHILAVRDAPPRDAPVASIFRHHIETTEITNV
jgi:hypothetical protein